MRIALTAALLLSAMTAAAAPAPAAKEVAAPELAAQLTKAVEKWVVDAADNAGAASDLKTKYRVLKRAAPGGGTIVGLLGPASVVPGRLIQYGDSAAGAKKLILKRGSLKGHFLVLEFDAQTQYRDLRKADSAGGLDLTGYVTEEGSAHGFKDAEAFDYALKDQVKTAPFKGIKEAAAKAAGGKPYTLEAVKAKDRVVIAAMLADGTAFAINPPVVKKK
jgi:hypothetical protein